jgi:hypothetical protein
MADYFKRLIEPAAKMPDITRLSPQHIFLTLILCLLSLELGIYLGEGPTRHHGSLLNLTVGVGLLMNCLAYSFQWSRLTTAWLRGSAWGWLLVAIAALFFLR